MLSNHPTNHHTFDRLEASQLKHQPVQSLKETAIADMDQTLLRSDAANFACHHCSPACIQYVGDNEMLKCFEVSIRMLRWSGWHHVYHWRMVWRVQFLPTSSLCVATKVADEWSTAQCWFHQLRESSLTSRGDFGSAEVKQVQFGTWWNSVTQCVPWWVPQKVQCPFPTANVSPIVEKIHHTWALDLTSPWPF